MSGCPGDWTGVKTAGDVEEAVALAPWKDERGAVWVSVGWMVVVTV